MIDYLPNTSIFYQRNLEFCERVTKELKALGIGFNGSCTSFGYDIFFTVQSGSVVYNINYHKHQSTGAPVGTRTRQYVNLKAEKLTTMGFLNVNGTRLFSPKLWFKSSYRLSPKHKVYANFKLDDFQKEPTLKALEKLKMIRLIKSREELEASFWNDSLLPSEIVALFDELIQTIAK